MTARITAVLAVVIIAACQSKPAPISEKDVAEIRELNGKYVSTTLAEDWDGWASQMTDDAVFVQPNGPAVEGRAALRKWTPVWAGLASFTAPVIEVVGSGSTAFARGTYTYATGPKAPVQAADSGKWLTVFERQADGSWKIKRNIWNSSKPLAAPQPAKPAKTSPAKKPRRKRNR